MTTLRWTDEVLAQTHDAFTVPFNSSSVDVYGSEGTLHATDALTQDPVGDLTLRDEAGVRAVDVGSREDLYVVSVREFTAAVEGTGAVAVTGMAGTQAVAVALAVQEAAETGRTVDVVDMRGLRSPAR